MKNSFIALLVILVLVLGGWLAYDKTRSKSASTSSNGTTAVTGGSVLDMSNKGLTKVGADIYGKTGTTELILSYNSLRSLPSQMGQMTNLQVLKLDHNQLQGALIAEIRKMPLVELDASYN